MTETERILREGTLSSGPLSISTNFVKASVVPFSRVLWSCVKVKRIPRIHRVSRSLFLAVLHDELLRLELKERNIALLLPICTE